MQFNQIIRQTVGETALDGLTSGTPAFFKAQEGVIKRKPLLKNSFLYFYENFKRDLASAPRTPGLKTLELGSGGGFLSELVPEVITSDIHPGIAQLTLDARDLPFEKNSLRAIFMASVLHHIPQVRKFFSELDRTLAPGGICAIVEPSNTPFARFFYPRFHHEPFEPKQVAWEFDQKDAMMDANQALSWMIFERDRKQFEAEFPNLQIEVITHLPTLSYLVSGGVNYRALLPTWLQWTVPMLETKFCFLNRYYSLAWYILIRKRGGQH